MTNRMGVEQIAAWLLCMIEQAEHDVVPVSKPPPCIRRFQTVVPLRKRLR